MENVLARLICVLVLAAGIPGRGSAQTPEPLFSAHLVTPEIKLGVKLCEQYRTGLKIAYEPTALLTLADVDSVSFAREGESGPSLLSSCFPARAGRGSINYRSRTLDVGSRFSSTT